MHLTMFLCVFGITRNESVLYTNILVICAPDVYILHCPILYGTHSVDTDVLHFTGREFAV